GTGKSRARKSSTDDSLTESVNTAWLVEAGKTFFKNGNVETGVPGCTGCHRDDGAGDKAYPRLAGQSQEYISRQLADFKAGARANDNYGLMRAVVARMTDQEIKSVAAYLAATGQ
ncbi:MAG TPA: c-type cytochrome, partial [Gallionella sp.]|nr:c-type cytochrome [Gallionella sp.]